MCVDLSFTAPIMQKKAPATQGLSYRDTKTGLWVCAFFVTLIAKG